MRPRASAIRGVLALAATTLAAVLAVQAGAAERAVSAPAAKVAAGKVAASEVAGANDAGDRAVLKKVCGRCHSVEIVLDATMSQAEWRDTIQTMVDRGAHATDDEFDAIVEYLDTHRTTINVNSAGADELQDVLELSTKAANAIVARRQARPFKDLADLETVPGLDARALEAKRKLIFF